MPVVITVNEGGFTVEVPACNGTDGIGSFNLTPGSEGRGAGDLDHERVIELTVTPATMADGSYNSDEVRVVSGGGEFVDPWVVDVSLSTALGYSRFSMPDVLAIGAPSVVVVGGRAPRPLGPDESVEAIATEWCSDR